MRKCLLDCNLFKFMYEEGFGHSHCENKHQGFGDLCDLLCYQFAIMPGSRISLGLFPPFTQHLHTWSVCTGPLPPSTCLNMSYFSKHHIHDPGLHIFLLLLYFTDSKLILYMKTIPVLNSSRLWNGFKIVYTWWSNLFPSSHYLETTYFQHPAFYITDTAIFSSSDTYNWFVLNYCMQFPIHSGHLITSASMHTAVSDDYQYSSCQLWQLYIWIIHGQTAGIIIIIISSSSSSGGDSGHWWWR